VKYAEEGALVAGRRDNHVPRAPCMARRRQREEGHWRSGTEALLDIGHGGTSSTSGWQEVTTPGGHREVVRRLESEPRAHSRLD
jgi:hypothetical protein